MRLAILSDTHGAVARTLDAARVFKVMEVDEVLHCGDIGDEEVVRALRGWPVHYVFGNVDSPGLLREAIARAAQTCHERFGHIEREGRRIAFLHGDDLRLLRETIASGQWHLVCHGHTHRTRNERVGETLVVNPGALYRTGRPSVALVDLPDFTVLDVAVA